MKTREVVPTPTPYGGEGIGVLSRKLLQEDKEDEGGEDDDRLDAAYASLEKMRKLNLAVACQERGVFNVADLDGDGDDPVFDRCCSTCILNGGEPSCGDGVCCEPSCQGDGIVEKSARIPFFLPRFPPLLFQSNERKDKDNSSRRAAVSYSPGKPCLLCGNLSCGDHSSATYRRQQGLTVCLDCEAVFSTDFVVDFLSASTRDDRRARLDRLVEMYDRTFLLLHHLYSAALVDGVATRLEEQADRERRVRLGTGSSGILVSSALGVAAAATLGTPAVAAPLLITSLVFGGGTAAVQTGNQVFNNLSEPNRLADHILALYGMLQSILRVAGLLDAMLRCQTPTDVCDPGRKRVDWEKHRSKVTTGPVSSPPTTSVADDDDPIRPVPQKWLHSLQRMTQSLQYTQAGRSTPREKAALLREFQKEADGFPATSELDADCDSFLDSFAECQQAMKKEDEQKRRQQQQQQQQQQYELDMAMLDSSVSSLDGSQSPSRPYWEKSKVSSGLEPHKADDSSCSSLLKRIEQYKDAQHSPMDSVPATTTSTSKAEEGAKCLSLLERIELHKQRQKLISL